MSARKAWGIVGLLISFIATDANATTGLSGGIGVAKAGLFIILACFLLAGVITFMLYKKYKKKWVWVFFPVISGCFMVATWSLQYL